VFNRNFSTYIFFDSPVSHALAPLYERKIFIYEITALYVIEKKTTKCSNSSQIS